MARFDMSIVIHPKGCFGHAIFNPPIPKGMEWKFGDCVCPFMQTEIDRGHGWDCACTLEIQCTFNAGDSECGRSRTKWCPFGTEEKIFPMGEVEIPDADLEIYKV